MQRAAVHEDSGVEAGTVRRIFDLYPRDRRGTNAIAGILTEQGLRTHTDKPWSHHTVTLLLTNRIYLGEKNFRDITVPDAHDAIITALLDFYTHRGDLIEQAITEFQAQHAADNSRQRNELTAITRAQKDTAPPSTGTSSPSRKAPSTTRTPTSATD
ncbi:recombinase family protein [Plantactinospora sp. DSM 117369]